MLINHVGLVCSTEDQCDKFYRDLLELDKQPSKILSPEISKQLFNLDNEYKLIYYSNHQVKFEIFLSDRCDHVANRVGHVCLDVADQKSFLATCKKIDVEIIEVIKGDSMVVFVKDFDGNLFEIKEKK